MFESCHSDQSEYSLQYFLKDTRLFLNRSLKTPRRDIMFKKHYEIIENPPQPISWDEYAKTSYGEYLNLLQNQGDDESAF